MRTELRGRLTTFWNDDTFVVAALGGVELVSYGTLYYCVAVVANEVARDLAVTAEWIFAWFSFALFASGLMSLIAGRLMDRYGAGRTMKIATVAAAASLAVAAISWNAVVFAIALFGMQAASSFLFVEAGVVFLVQRNASHIKRQVALLTLIIGFSSTLFWPVTSLLLTLTSWRGVFGIYAACNILVAFPLIARPLRTRPVGPGDQNNFHDLQVRAQCSTKVIDFALITVGFSLATFVFSAFLSQMIPILSSIGLGPEGALVSAVFGPSQGLIQLFAASLTERMAAIQLTLLSSFLLSAATVIVALAFHSVLGVTAFVVLLGVSSGLNIICRGTLPLVMFGQERYGSRLGLINAFRLATASFAPWVFSSIQDQYGVAAALAHLAVCGVGSMLAFLLVSMRPKL